MGQKKATRYGTAYINVLGVHGIELDEKYAILETGSLVGGSGPHSFDLANKLRKFLGCKQLKIGDTMPHSDLGKKKKISESDIKKIFGKLKFK